MIVSSDILKGVFYQGQKKERVDLLAVELWVETGLQLQLFRATGLLQLDEIIEIVQFLADCDGLLLIVELVTKQLGEFLYAFFGVGHIFIHLEINGVEGVEQKVRVVLGFEKFQLGLELVIGDLFQLYFPVYIGPEKGAAPGDAIVDERIKEGNGIQIDHIIPLGAVVGKGGQGKKESILKDQVEPKQPEQLPDDPSVAEIRGGPALVEIPEQAVADEKEQVTEKDAIDHFESIQLPAPMPEFHAGNGIQQ